MISTSIPFLLSTVSEDLNRHLYLYTILCSLCMLSCRTDQPLPYNITKSMVSDSVAVVSAHPLASQVGVEILKSGGNAADAAIAVQMALAVVYPRAGNLGGGGFMVYSGDLGDLTLDFREKAPQRATTDMFLDSLSNVIPNSSIDGHLACGVPGSVDGMWTTFQRLSRKRDWASLITPAIELATNGFQITEQEADILNRYADRFDMLNRYDTPFEKKDRWKKGDYLKQEKLANTLRLIQQKGRAGFYEGDVAAAIIDEVQTGGGIMTTEDLINYKSIWRNAITSSYKEHQIISMGPPSSGGIALSQLLETMEHFDLTPSDFHTANTIHLMTEAERWVYADRAKHLGDMDYYNVPVQALMEDSYIKSRAMSISLDSAGLSEETVAGIMEESEETTHLSIYDQFGNAVSLTTTLNGSFGSKVVVKDAGFILNNEMDDFSIKPGTPNMYGLIGSEANKIEPEKRMLSSMTPTIVKKNGKPYIIIGTPGGSTIITSVFQTIMNIIDFNQGALEAVSAPRFHHQWKPDYIQYEEQLKNKVDLEILEKKGHKLKERGSIGRVECILIRDKKIESAADPRGDDSVAGY